MGVTIASPSCQEQELHPDSLRGIAPPLSQLQSEKMRSGTVDLPMMARSSLLLSPQQELHHGFVHHHIVRSGAVDRH